VSQKRFYITTPIYYVNASPHLGHAYTSILCDAARRFYEQMGYETFFLTGTDEHGENIWRVAAEQGRSEKELVDEVSANFRLLWPPLYVGHDDFIRTSERRHTEVVRAILEDLHEKGDIYKADYEGVYCVQCERFYTEKELDAARPGLCPTHETALSRIQETNYFFRMSRYQDWLREKIESDPEFINPPQFANEVLAILRDPLGDLCISRPKARLPWGIAFPFDPDYVVYVWFDALVNYVSALGYPGGVLFQKFWPAANHVIAKDILRPHAVYWPTMLKAMGIPVYQRLHVHGWWQSDGKKMSKTLGNVVRPDAMAEKYGADALRYFVLREMVMGSDGDFTERALIRRYNSDLANDLGNLINRVTAMIHQFAGGRIPAPGPQEATDGELLEAFESARRALPPLVERLRLSEAIEAIMNAVRATNRYVDRNAPWELAKKRNAQRLAMVLHTAARAAVSAAGLLWPVMPAKCDEALACLGADPAHLDGPARWRGEGLAVGAEIPEGVSLFPRRDPGEAAAAAAKAKAAPAAAPFEPAAQAAPDAKPIIEYHDFAKLDLRVATIVKAEKHPKADRLLRLVVDLGGEQRQVIAGLAEHFRPEDLTGCQAVVVANLAPRALRGLESRGMILAAHDATGLVLIGPLGKAAPGSPVT